MLDTDKIFKFYNNELSVDDEQILFSEIAYNQELRNEFKTLGMINNSFKSTAKSYIPTPALTDSVFSALQIKQNTISNKLQKSDKIHSLKSNYFSKFSNGLLSGLLISLIPALLIVYFSSNHDNQNNIADQITNNGKQNNFATITSIPFVQCHETNLRSNSNSTLARSFKSNSTGNIIPNIKAHNINDNIIIAPIDDTPITTLTNSNVEPAFDEFSGFRHPKLNNYPFVNNLINSKDNFNLYFNGLTDKRFELKFNSHIAWNIPQESISPKNSSKFNNLSLAAFYNISNNFKVGAELRQETFFLKYYENNGNIGRTFFEQQPNLTTFDLAAQYSTLHFNNIDVLTGINFGINNYGIIGRISGGIEYNLYDNISLSALGEYSQMYYHHKTTGFTANKFNINYGINFHF
jgi:hypothetical protein